MNRPLRAIARCLLVAAGMIMAGCQPGPSPAVMASPTPAASPTSIELEAMRFRSTFGLRSDLGFIRAVSSDPHSSAADFGVPLLPHELDELRSRSANADAVRAIVAQEAEAHPQDYCGQFIDNDNGGAFTSMWRANLEAHVAAIRLEAGPFADLAFVQCTFAEAELNEVADRLGGVLDKDWLAEIPAVTTGWGPNIQHNRVEVDISSAVPDAASQIERHLIETMDLPPGMLAVLSDGTGVLLVPWGTVRITVTRADGTTVGPNDLALMGEPDRDGLACGGEIGVGVPFDDTPVDLPCQEGRWTIRVMAAGEVLGEARVVVHREVVVDLAIKLTRDPPPAQ